MKRFVFLPELKDLILQRMVFPFVRSPIGTSFLFRATLPFLGLSGVGTVIIRAPSIAVCWLCSSMYCAEPTSPRKSSLLSFFFAFFAFFPPST